MLAVCFEVCTIACTGLKEESAFSLSFWSYIFGITFSLFFISCSIIQLFPTIPLILYSILDMLFWPLVLGSTYFDVIALQNIDVGLCCIASNVT